jgi:lyso-ornithine lipid O-acyltransferase
MIHTLCVSIKFILCAIDALFHTICLYTFSWFPGIARQARGIPEKRSWYTRLYKAYFRYWCWSVIRFLGVSLYPCQHYKNPLPKNYILIANHPSVFEDLGMSALFSVRFLAKKEVHHWWVVGRIGAAAGTLYVNRHDRNDRQKASAALEEAVKAGDNVGIYPEGGCKGRRLSLPFYYGAFQCSLNTGIPLLPVFLEYPAQEDFEWANQSLLIKLLQIIRSRHKQVYYHIFDPIDPKNFKTVEAYCQQVQEIYQNWQNRFL